jgi:low affinity Fe/Cu permease
MARKASGIGVVLERFSSSATAATGSNAGFMVAVMVVVLWLVSGPAFHFSDTWQLVINTGTTVVTFLMVFLIQRSQNKESLAVQLKLNELVAAMMGASNRLIDVEDLSEHDLEILHKHYRRIAEIAKRDFDLTKSHSIEEAESRQSWKRSAAPVVPVKKATE